MIVGKKKIFEKLRMMNPSAYYGDLNKYVYEFIVSYHERLHNFLLVRSHRVKYITFQMIGPAKQY